MALTQVSDAGLVKPASDLQDNEKIIIGTGNDLEIYHDSNHSYIDNHTGSLKIRNAAAGNILIEPRDAESSIIAKPDGAVELYYDNSKKFETSDYGTWLGDNSRVTLGGSTGTPDCHFYADGTDTNIQNIEGDLIIKSTSGGAKAIVVKNAAAVELYHNNTKKFETASNGIQLLDELGINDGKAAMFGDSDDLKIYHNGTHSYIWNTQGDLQLRGDSIYICSTAGEGYLEGTANGAAKLFYDNVKKLETTSTGIKPFGNVDIQSGGHLYVEDNGQVQIGNNQDLKIWHDGSNSRIKDSGTGNLNIGSSKVQIENPGESEVMATFIENGAVELYYDNVKKFETTSTGSYAASRLDVGNNSWSYPKTLNVQGPTGSVLALRNWDTTTYASGTSTSIELSLKTGDTNNTNGACEIRAIKENGTNGDNARSLGFYTGSNGGNPTQRLVILGNGNIGIGITPQCTTGNILNLYDEYFIGFGDGGSGRPDFQIGTTGGSTLDFRCGYGGDTVDLSIGTDGIFTGDFNDTSDERLKENIKDIADNQINIVKQLRPVTFDWKATEKGSNTGFIAQEVIKLLPNDVTHADRTNTDSNLGINNMGLTAVLTKALQEAIAEIETLKTKVAALEAG